MIDAAVKCRVKAEEVVKEYMERISGAGDANGEKSDKHYLDANGGIIHRNWMGMEGGIHEDRTAIGPNEKE